MSREVRIGDRTYVVADMMFLKILLAGEMGTRISEKGTDISGAIADFKREYSSRNATRLTRAMAKLPRYAIYDEETGKELGPRWQADDFGDSEYVEIPTQPELTEQIVAVFHRLFPVLRQEIQYLLGLVVIPNSDLEQADRDGKADEAVKEQGQEIVYRASMSQIVELLLIAGEVLREEFADKADELGKLAEQIGFGPVLSRLTQPTLTPDEDNEDQSETPPQTEPDESPRPSTSSPASTNGHGETSSTGSPGESSVPTSAS